MKRPGHTENRFSPSSLGDLACPRAWYLNRVLNLETVVENAALAFGGSLHKGIAAFYKQRNDSFDLAKIDCLNAFIEEWESYGIMGDGKRSLDSGVVILEAYCNKYENDPAYYNPDFIEVEQKVEMENGSLLHIIIDRIEERKGGDKIVHDSKSSSRAITDYYFRQFENNLQMSLYFHGVEQVCGECTNVCIDALKVPNTGDPDKDFQRRSFFCTDLQIADAVNTYNKKVAFIKEGLMFRDAEQVEHFYCEHSRCSDYGGCDFLPICKHGLTHPIIQTDFRVKEYDA